MDSRPTFASLILLATLAGACGNGSPGTDAGDAADPDDGGFDTPTPPAPPAPPVLTPCPDGWVEVPPEEPGGLTTCDPWPDGGPAVLTPCPEDWREATDPDTGHVTCDPWPETGSEVCIAIDEAHFPGGPGCSRIGTACPPDDRWATDLPEDRPIRYVLADAPAGGDGTRTAPFGTIREAMTGASSGTIVALSKGTFDEVVVIPSGVTLWGACVAETLVASSAPAEDAGTLNVWGRDVEVRNLRVSGRRPGIWASGRSRTARVEDVVIDGATFIGWLVAFAAEVEGRGVVVRDTRSRERDRALGRGLEVLEGGAVVVRRGLFAGNRSVAIAAFDPGTSITLEDVAVRDTRSQESDRTLGRGLNVQLGASAVVRRALFERNRDTAVMASRAGTSLTLEDVVVRDTESRENDLEGGCGLGVQDGTVVVVRRGLFERNREAAILANGAGTSITLEDVVVRDTGGRTGDVASGHGLDLQNGATAVARRALFERNCDVAVMVSRAGASVSLEDVVVRDTRSREGDRAFGRGLEVQDGAAAEVRRALFERNRDVAIMVSRAGASVSLEDVVVRDTESRESDLRAGSGLAVQDGATAEVRRALFERNREVAVSAAGTDTSLTLEDVALRNTRSREGDRAFGRGLALQDGATAEVRRALFERNREVAVSASGTATSLTLEDVALRDTDSRESDLVFGRGLSVQFGVTAVVRRALFERNREVAVSAAGTDTSLTLEDVAVRDTRSRERDGLCGSGAAALAGAHVEIRRFLVTHSDLCGIQLARGVNPETGRFFEIGGMMDLSDGVVSHNTVCGANVQTPGFDLRRLQNRVRWHDNGIDLDTREMPVPDATTPSM
jgi:hypothetical protein